MAVLVTMVATGLRAWRAAAAYEKGASPVVVSRLWCLGRPGGSRRRPIRLLKYAWSSCQFVNWQSDGATPVGSEPAEVASARRAKPGSTMTREPTRFGRACQRAARLFTQLADLVVELWAAIRSGSVPAL